MVRCRHGEGAGAHEVRQQRSGERGALRRVGAGRKLVEERQRCRAGPLQEADDVLDVAAEGRKRLLDALLVANIGQHFFEDRYAAGGVGGHRQAGLGHEDQQPNRLQGDCLAASVRPRDQEDAVFASQGQRDRDRFGQERVACFMQLQLGGHAAQPALGRGLVGERCLARRRQLIGQAGGGHEKVHLGQDGDVFRERRRRLADDAAEAPENALDLALLLDLKLAPLVREVHDGQGLDEQRRAARGDVMDNAAHLAAEIGLDGDNVPAVAQGDDRLLGREPAGR